jgi:hypothetical protein
MHKTRRFHTLSVQFFIAVVRVYKKKMLNIQVQITPFDEHHIVKYLYKLRLASSGWRKKSDENTFKLY